MSSTRVLADLICAQPRPISTTRVGSWTCAALIGFCALVLQMGGQASAQSRECKAERVTVTGQPKFRPFTKGKELEGRGAAMTDAVTKWEAEVQRRFGDRWKTWSKASDANADCAPGKPGKLGKLVGGSYIGCTVSGRPCGAGEGLRKTPSAAAEPKPKASVMQANRLPPPERRREADRSPDRARVHRADATAYEREMAYQASLAAERDKAEARAWELELTRQRRLQELRSKGY